MAPPSPATRRDSPLLYLAIFLMFAPLGVITTMVLKTPPGWAVALISGAFSGSIATGWAYAFTRRRWWLIVPLIVAPILGNPILFRNIGKTFILQIGASLPPQGRMIVMAAMCVASTAAGFIVFMIDTRRYERRTARAHAELEVARRVHHTLVPPIHLASPIAEVYGRSRASDTMGGDLIDAVARAEHVDVFIGDVSGHGVGAGVVMAMLKSCIRLRLSGDTPTGLDQVLADANRVLADLTAPEMFATCVALRLTPGRMEFALAGHLPIFHYRAAQNRWDRHPNDSLPLGIIHGEHYAAGATTVAPGDILALFTDGLMEVQDGSGRELGLDRLAAAIERAPSDSLAAMHDAIMAAVTAHGPALDDQSLVLVRCR